jgi:hypothetical protein
MIPHTGLLAWPTTSDKEDDHHHHARGCCPRFPHDTRDAHETPHCRVPRRQRHDMQIDARPSPNGPRSDPIFAAVARPPHADQRHGRRLPAQPHEGEAWPDAAAMPSGHGGERNGRHRRHAAGICPTALPTMVAGEGRPRENEGRAPAARPQRGAAPLARGERLGGEAASSL